MTENRHESLKENIPAYVLGALSRAEASDLEKHLQTCQECKMELALYQQIGDGLSASISPLQTAPAIVKRKLLESLDSEAPARSKPRWGFRQFAMGALAFILLGFNLIAFQQIRDLRQQQAQLAGQIEKNLSYLLVWNLPLPPEDQVYQIWLVGPDGSRVDAGSFRPDTGHPFTSTALLTSRNFTEFTGLEVTVEPSGGSGAPTGERIMSVDY